MIQNNCDFQLQNEKGNPNIVSSNFHNVVLSILFY